MTHPYSHPASGTDDKAEPATDGDLLADFVRHGDGSAFSRLVERHISLVFGVASRRVQSRELAQEATQNTFCQLARYAAQLKVRESLAPWLHKVALREAGSLLRSERSRQRTLHQLAHSSEPPFTPGSPRTLSEAAEHLDEVLASLPELERRVLILRYLQGLSLREVANAESSSEEAVRKRVSRALDRLAALLARRGITASAMMSCLTPVPLWPAAHFSAIATRAIKDAAAFPVPAGLMGLTASWWPAAAVFLVAAIPTALFSGKNPEPENADALVSGGRGRDTPSSHRALNMTENPSETRRVADLMREITALKPADETKGYLEYSIMGGKMLTSISGESHADSLKRAALRRAMLDLPLNEIRQVSAALPDNFRAGGFVEILFARWAELDPEEALQAAAGRKGKASYYAACVSVLKVMARTDPLRALIWAKSNIPGWEAGITQSLAAADPAAYVRLMESPALKPEKPPANGSPYYEILAIDPGFALQGLRQKELDGTLKTEACSLVSLVKMGTLESKYMETFLSFAEGLPGNSELRRNCLQAAAAMQAFSSPARATEIWAASRPPDEEPGSDWEGNLTWLLKEWNVRDAAGAGRWFEEKGNTLLRLDPEALASVAAKAGLNIPDPANSSPVTNP